jgi:hypothetical protein
MAVLLRRAFLVATPLALAAVLWFHPPGGEVDAVYEGVRHDVGAWLFVHTVFLLFIPLMAFALLLLLRGLQSRAATVSRVSLVFFLVFYTAYEVTVGLGTGILTDYANGLPPAEQAAVADAIQRLNGSTMLGDPASVSLVAGLLGWVVATVAAAVALRRAGAGWVLTLLVGLSALFAIHPPPVGPAALVCFALAAVLSERRWARLARPGPTALTGHPQTAS